MTSYRLADAPPKDFLAKEDPLLRQLLFTRGVARSEDVEDFLNPHYENHLHDPFLMKDMDVAVERMLKAIRDNERIAIYSDYDCDGIPGGVLFHDFCTAVGYTNFENYIPHRHEEGYGLNVGAIETLKEHGVSLIVTVDCGITDTKPVDHARTLGTDVIITDHHEAGEVLPKAVAVLNPKRDDCEYPFKGLCGSGVAFKLIQGLLARGDFDLKPGQEKWWLDVVGIATIADMVPLTGENRALAYYGLMVLKKTRRPGLLKLLQRARLNPRYLSEDDIGFVIGPRINAASRMDDPEDAFYMLAERDEAMADARVRHLEKLNNERKGVVAAMVKEIKKRVEKLTELEPVLVVGNPSWRPALAGLAANSLAEEYKRPVFVWGRDGREVIKGSCRSDGGVSVVELMREVTDTLIEFGGHHASGGFAVKQEHIHTFPRHVNEAYERVCDAHNRSEDSVLLDADLELSEVFQALTIQQRLAPFGEGNTKPLFRFRGVVPSEVSSFGKSKEHTKATFEIDGRRIEAIAFFKKSDDFNGVFEKACDLIAHIEESFFMGRKQTRLRIVDVLP